MDKKEKKEKIIYYDDNSTIADMSNVKESNKKEITKPKYQSTAREKWNTYWSAVRIMVFPMVFVLSIIFVLYLIMMRIGGNF